MAIFFTADTHFGHENLRAKYRSQFPHIIDMDAGIISRWNSVVTKHDTVYHLGDVSWHKQDLTKNILDRLNGNICLIRGNHDHEVVKSRCASRFGWIKDYYKLKVKDPDAPGGRFMIVLSHFPFKVWDQAHYGAWHLHGHSHGGLTPDPMTFDVGADNCGLYPISYEMIKHIMLHKSIKYIPQDHHK